MSNREPESKIRKPLFIWKVVHDYQSADYVTFFCDFPTYNLHLIDRDTMQTACMLKAATETYMLPMVISQSNIRETGCLIVHFSGSIRWRNVSDRIILFCQAMYSIFPGVKGDISHQVTGILKLGLEGLWDS